MKTPAIILASFGLALGSLQAQTVPLFINYQGKVAGGTGIPLGSTGTAPNFTAAPVNRKIIFRIFDAPTAGTRLWSEQQTATIALGDFSVLLGAGIDAVYNSVTESRPALDTVFNGAIPPGNSNRYLEIVVDDGSGTFTTADAPVIPRQRITSTAYSLRARMADTVPGAAIDASALAAGAVTAEKLVDNVISSVKIADLSVLTEDLANNSVTAAKIADLSITGADLANATVTAAKLDPVIGVWTVNGANVYRPAGSAGIGKVPAAGVALDVAGQISATGNLTTQGSIAATGNITAAGALTGSSITTTGPFSATTITANNGVRIAGSEVLELGAGVAGKEPNAGKIGYQTFSGNSLDIIGAGTGANRRIKMWAEGGASIAGRLGIGTDTPTVPLEVAGNSRITMVDNGYISGQGGWIPGTNTYDLVDSPARVGGEGPEVYGMSGGFGSSGPNFFLGQNSRYNGSVAIRASGGYIASSMGIVVYSDRRIKRDAQASVTTKDLAAIQKLRVTDYRMVDPGNGGMAWRKGFIAQEVEEILPGAVTRSVEFVPDIFAVATSAVFDPAAKTLAVTLTKDHGLKAGELVRLHVDGSRLDLEVSAVPSAREFVVEKCERAPEKVLVYGRQVNDFRTVDYDRIFTTSVGALQELKKEKDAEVTALREENASLRDRLAALEANDKTRDAKLAAIETLLQSAVIARPAARTVSLSTGK